MTPDLTTIVLAAGFMLLALCGTLFFLIWNHRQKTVTLIITDRSNNNLRIKQYRPNPDGYGVKIGDEVKRIVPDESFGYRRAGMGGAWHVDAETGVAVRFGGPGSFDYMPGEITEAWLADNEAQKMAKTAEDGWQGLLQRAMPAMMIVLVGMMFVLGYLVVMIANKVGAT